MLGTSMMSSLHLWYILLANANHKARDVEMDSTLGRESIPQESSTDKGRDTPQVNFCKTIYTKSLFINAKQFIEFIPWVPQ